ncbi:MAG TPA: M56 family metallopeptidase, partial [Sphingomicrobium sp.]
SAAYGLWLIPALRLMLPPMVTTVERTATAAQPITKLDALQPVADPGLVDRLGGWETLAVSAWLAGAAAMLTWGCLTYRRQRREVLRYGVQLACLGRIRMVGSPAVLGPMAFGIIDRVIAVPVDFDDRFDHDERRLALEHELAHHRSGDLVLGHFAFALLCLQWFNPLAWMSHSAFRFDQEAACDARVLQQADGENRAAYARSIAKAASGRALLFAAALDRPRTLHRRLQSMLASPSSGRRFTGKALIALTAAAAMPLTASRATQYVDVPAEVAISHVKLAGTAMPAAAALASATTAAPSGGGSLPYPDLGGVSLGRNDVAFMADDTILIDGTRKSVDELTPSQRSRLRTTILKSQAEQARERAELPQRLAEAERDANRARSGEMKREHLRDIEDMKRDLAELDSESAELRAEGEDPAKRKAEIVADLREAEATDIDQEIRETLEEANPARIAAELREEEQQMARLLARLNQLDRR